MADEHDSWLKGIGVDVEQILTPSAPASPTGPETKAMKAKIIAAQGRAQNAMASYNDQKKINNDQWFVSFFSSIGAEDPGPKITQEVQAAKEAATKATAATDAGDLAKAGQFVAEADAAAGRAEKMASVFTGQLINHAKNITTGIKVVDTGAKVVGAVALTVGTGGAAAVVAGTATTVGAGTIATATAISVAGGMAASVAGAVTKVAIGDKVDWGMVSVDILMQALLARFGGNVAEGVCASVAKRLGPGIATAIIKNVVSQSIMHVGSTTLKTAVESVYQKLSGKNITWKDIVDSLIDQLTDPAALAVTIASTAAGSYVSVKATTSSSSSPPPGDKLPPPPPKPPAPAKTGTGPMARVGRWMSQAEYDAMKASGRVIADSTGQHRVAFPATPDAYDAAPKGDIYVEYDVPASSLAPGGTADWRTISGPGSMRAKLAEKRGEPTPELPEFKNLSGALQTKQ